MGAGRGISATPYHGWIKASWSPCELRERREAHRLPEDWWTPWHQAAQKDAQGLLCHNCSFPYVKYRLGTWFHKDDTGNGAERGFCVNLASPESLISGYPGPAQLIAECFVRFGMP